MRRSWTSCATEEDGEEDGDLDDFFRHEQPQGDDDGNVAKLLDRENWPVSSNDVVGAMAEMQLNDARETASLASTRPNKSTEFGEGGKRLGDIDHLGSRIHFQLAHKS